MKEINSGIVKRLHDEKPLIHCITNPISMMQCANAVLGLGAKPIMAEHPDEVDEITGTAAALLLNLGNISDTRMKAMEIAMDKALLKGIPIVIDSVGVACSRIRRSFTVSLLEKWHRESCKRRDGSPLVVKGNYSEIKALFDASYKSRGVDAECDLKCNDISQEAADFAREHGVIVMASGKIDIVTDGHEIARIECGVPMMGDVTGTGCMLGAICAGFLAAQADMSAVICACLALGIAGERADKNDHKSGYGNGSFLIGLLDEIYLMTDERIDEGLCRTFQEIP